MIRSPWTCLGLIFLLLVATAGADSMFRRWLPGDAANFAANLLMLAAALALFRLVKPERASARAGAQHPFSVAVWLGVSLLCITWINVAGSWSRAPDIAPASLDKACSPNVETWASLAQGLLISPVVEELLITGLLFSLLRGRYALRGSIALTAMAFALLHFPGNVVHFANRIAFEVLSCLLLLRTGRLWVNVAFHVMTNSTLFVVDGMEQTCRHLLSIGVPHRELWIAGLVTVAAIAATFVRRFERSAAAPHPKDRLV